MINCIVLFSMAALSADDVLGILESYERELQILLEEYDDVIEWIRREAPHELEFIRGGDLEVIESHLLHERIVIFANTLFVSDEEYEDDAYGYIWRS